MARVQGLYFSLRCLGKHIEQFSSIRRSVATGSTLLRTVWSGRFFSSTEAKPEPKTASFTFVDRDGDKKTVTAKYGELLLDVAKNNDVDLEGACEGTLSCSTCHLIFDPEEYARLDLPSPDDEELDMLDLAYGLTDTSRLGCQIEVSDKFEGISIKVPEATQDARNL